jgi:hypothetical protein
MRRKVAGAVVAAGVMSCVAVTASPSALAHGDGSEITVRADDYTPQSGQTFVLRGRFSEDGRPARGEKVRLQSYRQGWHNITGAVVTTDSDGRYRMRVILSVKGVRDLRVKGVSSDGDHHAFRRFVVEVQ